MDELPIDATMIHSLLRHTSLLILTALFCSGCSVLEIAIDVASREAMSRGHSDSLYPFEDVDGAGGLPVLSHERRAMYVRINKLAADGKSRIELTDGSVYEGRGLHVWADSTLFRVVAKRIRVERLASSGPRSVERMRAVEPEWKMVPTSDIVRLTAGPTQNRVRAGQLVGALAGGAAFLGLASLLPDESSGNGWGVDVGDVVAVSVALVASVGIGAAAGGAIASDRQVFEMKAPRPTAGAFPVDQINSRRKSP